MTESKDKGRIKQIKGPGGGPPMARPVEKAKDFKGTLSRLLSYLKPYKARLAVVVLMAIMSTFFTILSPRIMGLATTRIFEGFIAKHQRVPGAAIDFQYIAQIILILAGLYVLSAFFRYLQQYIMIDVTQETVFNMRADIENKLALLPLKYYDSHAHGEILSRVSNDVDTISSTLQQSLTQFITAIVTLVGILIMMLTISPLLTLIAIVTIPLSFLVTKVIASRSQRYFVAQQRTLGEINGHVEEMFTGHQVVKAFGHEHRALDEFKEINDRLYNVSWKAQFVSGMIMPLMTFISNIGYILVAVIGAVFVINRTLTIGEIQAFIQYSRQFTQPITETANIANIIQSTVAAAERVFEVLDEKEELPDPVEPRPMHFPQGHIRFENVSFSYDKESSLIEKLNIEVSKGQTAAIVGPTGAGKTTLVNLLMRFYEIDDGRITIDGVDIRAIKRKDLRSQFGMVLQDTWLFNGTIRENIAYGNKSATDAEIQKAAEAAHADHFIRTLPAGYETILNEETSNISQGQRQLLTIARAFLADPAILILDEATSSVDTRTEIQIQKAMTNLMQGRTSFVIAHRLSTIREANLILVMNKGKICEQGTHDELLAKGEFYADLYNSQFAEIQHQPA